jgi:hypothetical protein
MIKHRRIHSVSRNIQSLTPYLILITETAVNNRPVVAASRAALLEISGHTSDDDDGEEAGSPFGLPPRGSGAPSMNAPDDSAVRGLKPRWDNPLDMLKKEVRYDSILADRHIAYSI